MGKTVACEEGRHSACGLGYVRGRDVQCVCRCHDEEKQRAEIMDEAHRAYEPAIVNLVDEARAAVLDLREHGLDKQAAALRRAANRVSYLHTVVHGGVPQLERATEAERLGAIIFYGEDSPETIACMYERGELVKDAGGLVTVRVPKRQDGGDRAV